MKIQTLLEISSALDIALIERQIQGQIGSYVMDISPDEGKIEITTTHIKPIKRINCSVKLGKNFEVDNSRK